MSIYGSVPGPVVRLGVLVCTVREKIGYLRVFHSSNEHHHQHPLVTSTAFPRQQSSPSSTSTRFQTEAFQTTEEARCKALGLGGSLGTLGGCGSWKSDRPYRPHQRLSRGPGSVEGVGRRTTQHGIVNNNNGCFHPRALQRPVVHGRCCKSSNATFLILNQRKPTSCAAIMVRPTVACYNVELLAYAACGGGAVSASGSAKRCWSECWKRQGSHCKILLTQGVTPKYLEPSIHSFHAVLTCWARAKCKDSGIRAEGVMSLMDEWRRDCQVALQHDPSFPYIEGRQDRPNIL